MTDTRHARGGGDRDEIQRAQRGDRQAFLQLYDLHAPMTWRLALVAGRDRAAAEAAVVGAFAHVLGHPDRRDPNRFAPVGAQLLRSAREGAIEGAHRVAEPAGLEAIADGAHRDTVRAFDRLPERWRSVLWLDQVEHSSLRATAFALETSDQTAVGLGTRALGGFREQLSQLKAEADLRPPCRQTTARLSGYVSHALPSGDTLRVRRHLDRCEECRTRLDELDDVTTHLRGALPALPLAIESLAMGAWLARAHHGSGPIGLRLPGGALAPAWVERSLAGATAAVVSLGITAAVLLNARDGGNPVPTESAIARAEGEQALAGDVPTDDGASGGTITVVSQPDSTSGGTSGGAGASGASGGGSGASSGDTGVTASPSGEIARGGTGPTGPTAPTGPGPSPSPTPPPPPTDPTDPPPAVSDPVDQVVTVADDVVEQVCGGLGTVCEALPVDPPSLPALPGL
ncbi:MAG: zf-HC2 domain-containing protein [Acidimicrobiales bacterium]